ncbi:MAG TPA: hypothetical protein PLM35_07135 [Cyclobacteriaceae bacterium]|nr:hypothetical protein [Cyclobacteriaceae bacterium]
MKVGKIIFLSFLLSTTSLPAQVVGDMEDESKLYAETKQINQFFRRFNGEEDEKGERYYPTDKPYRATRLRKKYLEILFDRSNAGIGNDLKAAFARDVLEKDAPIFLDFHGPGWFAEVQTLFSMKGKDQRVTLFMKLEKHHLGTRWVIFKAHDDMLAHYYKRDTMAIGKFLHPMSHELDFMNLRKAFIDKDSVAQFVSKKFEPDHLSVFLYEVERGDLTFKSVGEVKFHFFQVPGWYFELAEFNRPGYNTGWLISNLVKLNDKSDENLLRKYVLREVN